MKKKEDKEKGGDRVYDVGIRTVSSMWSGSNLALVIVCYRILCLFLAWKRRSRSKFAHVLCSLHEFSVLLNFMCVSILMSDI